MAAIPVPFSDIAKPTNDLLNRDFYHTQAGTYLYIDRQTSGLAVELTKYQANLEIKSKVPNGVNFNVKGKSAHDGPITASLEGKYTDKGNGLTFTQNWTTANQLDTKVELENNIANGLKAELLTNYLPNDKSYGGKLNLFFKQPMFHTRAFVDLFKGPTATVDAVVGHEGYVAGAEAGYDVQAAAIKKWSLALGYSEKNYSAAITATNSLTLFSANYFHIVNSQVQMGAKATWDKNAGSNVGLEVATKYALDPSSFVKAKINDRGIAALAYNVKLSTNATLGLGLSLDTQNLSQAAHKVGASFTFEG